MEKERGILCSRQSGESSLRQKLLLRAVKWDEYRSFLEGSMPCISGTPPEGHAMRRVGGTIFIDQCMQNTIEALGASRTLFSSPANPTKRIAWRDSRAQLSPRQDDQLE
eukprot:9494064-Pyramimonas_sp.AAC.1